MLTPASDFRKLTVDCTPQNVLFIGDYLLGTKKEKFSYCHYLPFPLERWVGHINVDISALRNYSRPKVSPSAFSSLN